MKACNKGNWSTPILSISIWLKIITLISTGVNSLVPSPPYIVKQPPSSEIFFGVAQRQDEIDQPFLIECEAGGDPQPKYSWVKNGKRFNWQSYNDRITQLPGIGTLNITAPRNEDIGQYQCYANNELGTATSNSFFARKVEMDYFKDKETLGMAAEEGKPFKLPCSLPDKWPRPEPKYYWVQQNLQGALKLINSSRITTGPYGDLWFSYVTKNDRSQDFYYVCAAFSPFRNVHLLGNRILLNVAPSSSSASLNKHPPVAQFTTNTTVTLLKGGSADFWCIFAGTPLPEIKWVRTGGQIPTDRVRYENYGKTLKIQELDFSDEGIYECIATNGVGTSISHTVTVSVSAAPYFTVEPEVQNATEGETVEFRCEAAGKPLPEIEWIHNGVPLDESPSNPRRRRGRSNRIIIENLKKEDTGNYGCNATNNFGYVYKDVFINVLALPAEITDPPADRIYSVDKKTVTLRCGVFGFPKPLVRWIREGQELTGGRYRIMESGYLEISSVKFQDAGSYTCHAENKFGSDNRTGSLVVKEHTRINDRPQDYEVAVESTAIFRCSAVADSTLTLTIDWLRDNTTIDFEAEQRYVKLQDDSLTIKKASKLDSGLYTCLARTELDEASAEATLVVQDKPNAPELTGITCNTRDAAISWKAMGDNRSPILYYTIQYNTSFTPDSWEVAYKDVPATESSYTVSVSPWANYTFRVIARNKIGPSKPSSHSDVCSTPPDVPFMNPNNVKGHGNRPDNLVISWTPMPQIQHNAPKFRYVVQWKVICYNDNGTLRWNREEVKDWRRDILTVPNQPTYEPYRIRVQAVNERGESSVTPAEVQGFSGQDKPLLAPENFTLVEVVSYKIVVVSWEPVPPESLRGKFEGYKVEHWTDDDDAEKVLVRNDATIAGIEDLVPFAKNYLRIRVYNTDYDGPPSKTVEVVMEEGVPGPVELFKAFPLGQSAFYLSWKKPQKANGILKGYEIYHQKVEGGTLGPKLERSPGIDNPYQTSAKLVGLQAGTKYRIHIHAKTVRGEGQGYFVEETTYTDVATSLAAPRFSWSQKRTDTGISTVRVFWKPNVDGQGRPGLNFYVQFKRKEETTYNSTDLELDDDYLDVRGLDPGEKYIFRVVAVDGNLEQISFPEEIHTHALRPVYSPPSIVKQPSAGEVPLEDFQTRCEKTQPILLECEAEGHPIPTYSWTKDGEDLKLHALGDRISHEERRGTLVIKHPRNSDIGRYQCFARNELGTATSDSVILRKAEADTSQVSETLTVTAEEGKPLTLPCRLHRRPNTVNWIHQNLQGALRSINSERITVDPEGHLWFLNVEKDDHSEDYYYACAVFYPFSNEYKIGNRIYLNVTPASETSYLKKQPPIAQYTTNSSTMTLKGQDVDLWCVFSGTPLPKVTWVREGYQLSSNKTKLENFGKTLRIQKVDFSDEGIYDCFANNGVGPPRSHSVSLSVLAVPYFTLEPEIQNLEEGQTADLRCEALGKPHPEIRWIHNGAPLEQATYNPRRRLVSSNRIIIENVSQNDTGNYGCNATNSFSYVYKDVYVNVLSFQRNRSTENEHVPPVPPSNTAAIWISSTMGVALAGALFLGLAVWRKYKYAVNVIRNLTKEEVDEFYCGNSGRADNEREWLLGDGPYKDDKIIRSEDLKIESTILGQGQFGIVHKGIYHGECVAVKSSKSSADVEYFKAFLKEIKLMAYIGDHDNIVRFHGAVVDKIEERVCLAVLELSPFGDLNGYLRTHSKEFSAESVDLLEESPNQEIAPAGLLNGAALLNFCRQIAAGMDYLAQKQVIHGDLAARNVLVFENNAVKITDFGLSRKLYNYANYTKKNSCALPWRWMAIESLRFFEFSTKSDVWSFGVTMWEIFSLAQVPFSGVNWTTDFMDQLQSGFRLTKPQHCTPKIFDWMMKCWENQPEDRPAFAQCLGFLSMSNHISLNLENEANYYPIDRGNQMSV